MKQIFPIIGYLLLLVPVVLLAGASLGRGAGSGSGMKPADSPGVRGPASLPLMDRTAPQVYQTASFGLG